MGLIIAGAGVMLAGRRVEDRDLPGTKSGRSRSISQMEGGDINIDNNQIRLPKPRHRSEVSAEEAILRRRSIRDYRDEPLTIEEISQLLWAAQGITANWGGRAAPSAGATYPLEIYLVAGEVSGLEPAVYHYRPRNHTITKTIEGDVRRRLANAALDQKAIANAPISLIFCAVYGRTTGRYGQRGIRYVHMEIGHVGQNIYLQAEALALATVAIGAFRDEAVKNILGLKDQEPLYIMPVGRKMR